MPHEPRKFTDKEHAEMMVYALEEHFLRISDLLDTAEIPSCNDEGKLTVLQRVWLLTKLGKHPLRTTDELFLEMPEDDEGEDPEEVSEKIAKLYEVVV